MAVHLLGPPRIERDGVAISVDTRKAIALLACLAAEVEPQSRETLAALFGQRPSRTAPAPPFPVLSRR